MEEEGWKKQEGHSCALVAHRGEEDVGGTHMKELARLNADSPSHFVLVCPPALLPPSILPPVRQCVPSTRHAATAVGASYQIN